MDFAADFSRRVALVEQGLDAYLPPPTERPTRLHEAMRYSLSSGGKRLRPVLVIAAAELFDLNRGTDAMPAATAIECLHTY